MPELLWAQGVLCRNFCGLRGGGMPELLCAQGGDAGTLGGLGGLCRNFCGLRGGYAGIFGG